MQSVILLQQIIVISVKVPGSGLKFKCFLFMIKGMQKMLMTEHMCMVLKIMLAYPFQEYNGIYNIGSQMHSNSFNNLTIICTKFIIFYKPFQMSLYLSKSIYCDSLQQYNKREITQIIFSSEFLTSGVTSLGEKPVPPVVNSSSIFFTSAHSMSLA